MEGNHGGGFKPPPPFCELLPALPHLACHVPCRGSEPDHCRPHPPLPAEPDHCLPQSLPQSLPSEPWDCPPTNRCPKSHTTAHTASRRAWRQTRRWLAVKMAAGKHSGMAQTQLEGQAHGTDPSIRSGALRCDLGVTRCDLGVTCVWLRCDSGVTHV